MNQLIYSLQSIQNMTEKAQEYLLKTCSLSRIAADDLYLLFPREIVHMILSYTDYCTYRLVFDYRKRRSFQDMARRVKEASSVYFFAQRIWDKKEKNTKWHCWLERASTPSTLFCDSSGMTRCKSFTSSRSSKTGVRLRISGFSNTMESDCFIGRVTHLCKTSLVLQNAKDRNTLVQHFIHNVCWFSLEYEIQISQQIRPVVENLKEVTDRFWKTYQQLYLEGQNPDSGGKKKK